MKKQNVCRCFINNRTRIGGWVEEGRWGLERIQQDLTEEDFKPDACRTALFHLYRGHCEKLKLKIHRVRVNRNHDCFLIARKKIRKLGALE